MVIVRFQNRLFSIYLSLISWILRNKFLSFVLVAYAILMLTILDWGIPGLDHPFNYQMDEWHQLQAVKTALKDFSANVPGSAHGTMFHFILSGLYLSLFYLLGIINPFIIRSSVEFLQVQQKLFEILRLNTLIFGLLSIFFIAKVAREHLKVNQNIVIILFAITPLWLSLSNYFKYDIALVFWIIISLYYLLKFGTKPTLRNYLLAGIFCALAVSTKISAIPLFIAYITSFFSFKKKGRVKFKDLSMGVFVFCVVFVILGIPDLILGKGDYREFLYSNLVSGQNGYSNLISGFANWWEYWFVKILPLDFGYGFIALYCLGIIYWITLLVRNILKHEPLIFKKEFFLLFCFILFSFSLIPLKLGANGNRLLVLLPFFVLLTASFLQKMKSFILNHKLIAGSLLMAIFIVQFYQSIITVYVKWLPDVRQVSSQWMEKNIKKNTLIGIENIPIYQLLPDIVIKEFYLKERNSNYSSNFNYQIINNSSKTLPPIVIITDKKLDSYFKKSSKKELTGRLIKEGYNEIVQFNPPKVLYSFAGTELNYFTSGLAPIPMISIFEKGR